MDETSRGEILFSNSDLSNIVVSSSQQVPDSGRNDVEPITEQLFDRDSTASSLSRVDQTIDHQLQNEEFAETVLSFRKSFEMDNLASQSRFEAVTERLELTVSSREESVSLTFSAPSSSCHHFNFVMSQTRTEVTSFTLSEPIISPTFQFQSAQPHRISLSLADRDQLRAMIVMLNESNSVLLKLRHRFPLSAPTRCDVIQRQIQIQLQELFGEFRRNDVELFRSKILQNREIFLIIWNQIANLITELCYHA